MFGSIARSTKLKKIIEQDKTKGIIKAKTKMNWESWGSKITLELSQVTESSTEISINVFPKLKTVLIDSGECLKIAENLKKALETENKKLIPKFITGGEPIETDFLPTHRKKKN